MGPCKLCGKPTIGNGITGLCRSCWSIKDTPCQQPGCKNKITTRNGSGYCKHHVYIHSEAYHGRCAATKSLARENAKKHPIGAWVTCHNSKNPKVGCRQRFRLEWWQHAKMAWCMACRQTDEYQTFGQSLVIDIGGTPKRAFDHAGHSFN